MVPVGVCHRMSRRHSICALLVPAVVLFSAAMATRAAEPAVPEELPRMTAPASHYLGALSCASASCHGRQDEEVRTGSVSRQEYIVWLEHDPHAKAARTLEGEKFQRILRVVSSGRADGQPDAQVYLRCAQCHDPQGVTSAGGNADDLLAGKNIVTRGIRCESCHGPAKNWIAVHYERDVTREQLVELGMIDTKNLVVRAEQCAGCHVGDADKDMNHDMIAAGHPPLRFELSAYHDLIRQKHWPVAERVRTPDFKTQLWVAGQVAVVRSSLALLESRGKRAAAGDKATPWPEFAEYDCFACHQRLRPAAGFSSVALKGAKPGVPGWQPWNLALAERLLADTEAGPALGAVRAHLSESLVADPAQTGKLAATAHKHLEQHPLRATPFTAASLLALLEPAIQQDQSWAARSQQLLALRAGDLLARDERLRLQPPPDFASVTSGREERRSEPVDDWDRDWRSVAAALRFGSPKFEWPAFDWEGLGVRQSSSLPPMSADQMAENLKRLAERMRHRSEITAP
jgi:hypothetical protein